MMQKLLILIVAGLGFARFAAAQTPAESGLRQLDASVQQSCLCAGRQQNGIQAALTCTQDLNTFAGLKLDYREQWTPPQQQLARRIEQIVETCLSQALDYRQTLVYLGIDAPFNLPRQPAAANSTPYYWQKIPPRQLSRYPSRLVRIDVSPGESEKGLVTNQNDKSLRLMRARRDGGGLLEYNLDDIQAAWVLLPSPAP